MIDQHLHPVLGALTLAVEVIAPEDWVLPGAVHRAANGQDEYLARLREAAAKLKNPNEWLLTWGYLLSGMTEPRSMRSARRGRRMASLLP